MPFFFASAFLSVIVNNVVVKVSISFEWSVYFDCFYDLDYLYLAIIHFTLYVNFC